MFKVFRLMLLSAVVLVWSLPVQGQAQSSRFKYQVTPYFWFSGIDGDVGVLGRSANANVSFGDIWDNLKFGAMGTFEGRWNRWVFLGDVLYMNLAHDRATPNLIAFSNAEVKAKTLILDPEFGYQIVRGDGGELNLLAGVRYWHLKNSLQFSDDAGGSLGLTETRNWVDPIVGMQYRADLGRMFYVTAKGDIGGFSAAARLDWQAFGGLGIRFSDRVSALVGYRHLAVDYSKDGFLYDTELKGIVVGLGIRF
jgi:hypothetical protein